jgi:hypothetical protein
MDHFSTDGYARDNDVLACTSHKSLNFQLLQLLNCRSRILLIFSLAFFVARSIWADGGTIRFQGDAGLFHVTVFTLPPILTAGSLDVTVLVQDRSKLNPLLDANVTFDLTAESGGTRQTAAWLPPACAMSPTASLTGIVATLNHGENRLLYGAFVQVPYSGTWKLKINIRRATERESVDTLLRINPPTPPALGYWQLFILPPLGVLGFIVNRSVRRRHRA